jgi:hypothetical protein
VESELFRERFGQRNRQNLHELAGQPGRQAAIGLATWLVKLEAMPAQRPFSPGSSNSGTTCLRMSLVLGGTTQDEAGQSEAERRARRNTASSAAAPQSRLHLCGIKPCTYVACKFGIQLMPNANRARESSAAGAGIDIE